MSRLSLFFEDVVSWAVTVILVIIAIVVYVLLGIIFSVLYVVLSGTVIADPTIPLIAPIIFFILCLVHYMAKLQAEDQHFWSVYFINFKKFFWVLVWAFALPILINSANTNLYLVNQKIWQFVFNHRFVFIPLTFLIAYFPVKSFKKLGRKIIGIKILRRKHAD